ncbi:hypothetical protein QBC39DRAFT_382350 [Podospora conica]|nr:hypothetical protein QBC39DRAFT_382350 [Schizothecium conicum]
MTNPIQPSMPTFPFNKLPAELQREVWKQARANIGVITGDLEFNPTDLTVWGDSVQRLKDFMALLSTCVTSRQEALRRPLVFIAQDPECLDLEYYGGSLIAPVSIKSGGLVGLFSDIVLDVCLISWWNPVNGQYSHSSDRVRDAILNFFGSGIRRVHVYGREPTESIARRLKGPPLAEAATVTGECVNQREGFTTFPDADALHFFIPGCDPLGLREVFRQDVHCVPSMNAGYMFDDQEDLPVYLFCHKCPEGALEHFIPKISPHLPDFEYASLVAVRGLSASDSARETA